MRPIDADALKANIDNWYALVNEWGQTNITLSHDDIIAKIDNQDTIALIETDGDAVSRQAVKEQMIKYGFHAPDMTVTEFVEDLPSVAIPNKGHWIELETWGGRTGWRCSECRRDYNISARCSKMPYKFCPNCGCPMEIER